MVDMEWVPDNGAGVGARAVVGIACLLAMGAGCSDSGGSGGADNPQLVQGATPAPAGAGAPAPMTPMTPVASDDVATNDGVMDMPPAGDPADMMPMDGMAGDDEPAADDSMEDAPVAAGPLVLPAPDEVGPYEAIAEENVGVGFENSIASGDQGDGLGCLGFIMSFGQDEESARNYAMIPDGHDMALYTLYRPAEIPHGVKLPALSWANGTCAHPVGYSGMINHIVSHGFIVVAAHSRYTGSGAAQVNGINFLVAENENPDSPLFGHIDTEALGIFGHSQGSSSTANASDDSRVQSVVFMHGGTANPDAPALFLTSDIEARGVLRGYEGASGQAAYGNLDNSDHITMMVEHERMAPEVTAWFRYTLLEDDAEAASWFAGADCLMCSDSEWEYMAKGLD